MQNALDLSVIYISRIVFEWYWYYFFIYQRVPRRQCGICLYAL